MKMLAAVFSIGCALAQESPIYEDARVRISEIEGRGIRLPGVFVHAKREVVIEFQQRPSFPRNVCSEVLAGEYLHCHEPGPQWLGANLQMQVETDQVHIGIVEIAPGATLAVPPADIPAVLIALEGTTAEAVSHANGAPNSASFRRNLSASNVLRSPADQVTEVRNTGKVPARFLVVEFGGSGE